MDQAISSRPFRSFDRASDRVLVDAKIASYYRNYLIQILDIENTILKYS